MKASFLLAVGLTYVSAAMGSRCRPSTTSSSTSPSASPTCNGDIIKDGTFPNNKFSPYWTTTGNAEVNPNCYTHGVSCAHVQKSGASGSSSISQEVTTVVGQEYEVSFNYRVLAAHNNPTITVSQDGTVIDTIPLTFDPSKPWLSYTFQFTATGTQTELTFAVNWVQGANGNVDFTNFESQCAAQAA